MKALERPDLPVPRVLALCEDDERDRHGVLSDGASSTAGSSGTPALPELETRGAHRASTTRMNEALARSTRSTSRPAGLSDFGKPGSYFARQRAPLDQAVPRQRDRRRSRTWRRLIAWLGANVPPDDGRVGAGARRLPHRQHDLRFRIAAPARRARLGAFDARPSLLRPRLSVHAVALAEPRRLPRPRRRRPHGARHPDRGGVCRRLLPAHRACRACRTGRSCLAFSFFRLAAIVQGVYKRALDGNASNPRARPQDGRSACR